MPNTHSHQISYQIEFGEARNFAGEGGKGLATNQ